VRFELVQRERIMRARALAAAKEVRHERAYSGHAEEVASALALHDDAIMSMRPSAGGYTAFPRGRKAPFTRSTATKCGRARQAPPTASAGSP
jgi:hypothetical protein